jgi:hypothetical protein
MSVFPRRLVIGALTLLLLNSACNLPGTSSPEPIGTILPNEQATSTTLPTAALSNETPTALIPITGMDTVSLQCQFCVNDEPHAVLILPETAHFDVSDPSSRINCITAQVVDGRRILLCRGAQQASFNLNVCEDDSNCLPFPVTLEICPLIPQSGTGMPLVTSTPRTPVVVTPTATLIPPASPANTVTPAPAQTVISPFTAAATTAPPTVRQPRTGLHDPEGFVRWYFGAVWRDRDYQNLWDNYLTPGFKTRTGSGSYEDYAEWWGSVERVDVDSVEVIQNDGMHAWIRVNVTFTMIDGRIISNQEYDYDLLYDAARRTWMFDYRT